MERVFIVGFPRSGTTLVHGILAASDVVLTFPETHYFARRFTGPIWKRMLVGRRRQLDKIIANIFALRKRETMWKKIKPQLPDSSVDRFDFAITALALEEEKSVWVEKTPRHLYAIDKIQETIPTATFIHVLREPVGAVKSYSRATSENPKDWSGKVDIPRSVKRWNSDLAQSLSYRNDPRHYMLRFDKLVSNPPDAIRDLCGFLKLPYSKSLLRPESSYDLIVMPWEKWKANNEMPIGSQSSPSTHNDAKWDEYIQEHCCGWDEVVSTL